MTQRGFGGQSEVWPLRRVLVRPPGPVVTDARVAAEWRALGYTAPPDPAGAARDYAAFTAALTDAGAEVIEAAPAADATLDAIYVRDAAFISDRGAILCRMGKPARTAEPDAVSADLRRLGIPLLGRIEPPGKAEGGDLCWLAPDLLLAGLGYRTDAAGVDQLQALLGPEVHILRLPLVHWTGPGDVLHAMSLVSPVAEDRLLVTSRLLPVIVRTALLDRGFGLVEVPDAEVDALGGNVLALAPGRCLMVDGCPETRRRLEAAGCEVSTYPGTDLSLKGQGGPTCLTRPLLREAG